MDNDHILLGWAVDDTYRPRAFSRKSSPERDWFCFSPKALEAHTILFAQSGSGKSTLVARLIEELALKTQARLVVMDPNSDYRHIRDSLDEPSFVDNWDPEHEIGNKHIESHEEFSTQWKQVTCLSTSEKTPTVHFNRIDSGLLVAAERQESMRKIRANYEFLIEFLSLLTSLTAPGYQQDTHSYLRRIANTLAPPASVLQLQIMLPFEQDKGASLPDPKRRFDDILSNYSDLDESVLRRIVTTLASLDPHLFTLTREDESNIQYKAVNVIDIPKIGREVRYTVVCALLDKLWEEHETAFNAGSIRPTLIFVDEAHNLAPRDTQDVLYLSLIRERIRRIAAEGRKYGLFLTLISQRPDKLDPLTVSECENRVIMRVASTQAIDDTAHLLGLNQEQRSRLHDASRFKKGRAFALGPLAHESNLCEFMKDGIIPFYGQPRRTKAGAPDLEKWW